MAPTLEELKKNCRAVLGPHKDGLTMYQFEKDYRMFFSSFVPFRDLGYPNMPAFIQAIPDAIATRRQGADMLLCCVHTAQTAHIGKMVSQQKSNKKRSQRGKPVNHNIRRPVPGRQAWANRGPNVPQQKFRSMPRVNFYNVPFRGQQVVVYNTFGQQSHKQVQPARNNNSVQSHSQSVRQTQPLKRYSPPSQEKPAPAQPARQPLQRYVPSQEKAVPVRQITPPKPRVASKVVATRSFTQAMSQANSNKKTVTELDSGNLEISIRRSPANAATTKFANTYEMPPRFQRLQQERQQPLLPDPPSRLQLHFDSNSSDQRCVTPEGKVTVTSESSKSRSRSRKKYVKKKKSVVLAPPVGSPPPIGSPPAIGSPPDDLDESLGHQRSFLQAVSPTTAATYKDYKSALQHYANIHKRGRLEYETTPVRQKPTNDGQGVENGFVSSISVWGQVYGSGIDVYRSKRAAEHAAAQNACESLGLFENPDAALSRALANNSGRGSVDGVDKTLKARVEQLLGRRSNGLWNSRLPQEYKETFSEDPPANLISMVETWTDIVKVDCVEGTDRKILYPVLGMKIPDPVLPKIGSKVNVFVCHVVSCNSFYVQRADCKINNIMADIQPVYNGHASPNHLSRLEIGTYCVAGFDDGQWYRAQLLSTLKQASGLELDICYVDFGNLETVPCSKVHAIQARFCDEPIQAFQCKLHGVYPVQGKGWDQKVTDRFNTLVQDRELVLDIVNIIDNVCVVRAIHSDNLDVCVGDVLLHEGLASHIDLHATPATLKLPDDKEWNVYVSYVNSTTDVIVRIVSSKYSDLLEALEEDLPLLEKQKFASWSPQVGSLCGVPVTQDGETAWFRVRVVAVDTDAGKAKVDYVDHGDDEVVRISDLRPLTADFLQLPFQAVSCKLTGLEPYENDERIVKEIQDLALGKTCVAEIDDRFVDKVSVTLYDTSTDQDVNINETVAQVLSDKDMKPKLPEAMSTVEAFVSFVSDLGQIYVQIQGPGLQRLDELMGELGDTYATSDSSLFVPNPKIGDLYIAKYTDSQWYRAEVTQLHPQRRVEVYFVDYGNSDIVSISCLRGIAPSKKHIGTLPYQALEVSLYGLPPGDCEWTPAALDRLVELMPADLVRIVEVVHAGSGPVLPSVEVYWTEDEELVAVSEVLCREQYLFSLPTPTPTISDSEVDILEGEDDSDGDGDVGPGDSDVGPGDGDVGPGDGDVGTGDGDVGTGDGDVSPGDYGTSRDSGLGHEEGSADLAANEDSILSLQNLTDQDISVRTVDEYIGDISADMSGVNISSRTIDEYLEEQEQDTTTSTVVDEADSLTNRSATDSLANRSDSKTDTSVVSMASVKSNSSQNMSTGTNGSAVSMATDSSNGDAGTAPRKQSISEACQTDFEEGARPKTPTMEMGVGTGDSGFGIDVTTDSEVALQQEISEGEGLPPSLPIPRSGDEVFVTWVEDPGNFRCIPCSSMNELQTLMQELNAYCCAQEYPSVEPSEVQQDHLYAGFFEDMWYRVGVKFVLGGTGQVSIHFVDYGDYTILPIAHLRALPAKFRQLPYQSMKVSLAGVVKTHEAWSQGAKDRFKELVLEKVLTAWVHHTEDTGFVSVTLLDPECPENAFIHKVLINESWAKKWDGSS